MHAGRLTRAGKASGHDGGQFLRVAVVELGVVDVRDLAGGDGCGFGDFRDAVPDGYHGGAAAGVQVFPPGGVVQPDSFTAHGDRIFGAETARKQKIAAWCAVHAGNCGAQGF